MQIEVDQSGHIEATKDNTALAFSNGKTYSILIPTRTARACVRELHRKRIKAPNLQTRLFSAALFFLLKDHVNEHISIVIDVEYMGLDRDIRKQLLELLRQDGIFADASQITFTHIGKKSPAHDLAIATYRGKTKADRIIGVEEMMGKL